MGFLAAPQKKKRAKINLAGTWVHLSDPLQVAPQNSTPDRAQRGSVMALVYWAREIADRSAIETVVSAVANRGDQSMRSPSEYNEFQRQLMSLRRWCLGLTTVLAVVVFAGASGPLQVIVCRMITVKDGQGVTRVQLSDDGDTTVGGKLTVQGDARINGTLTVGGMQALTAIQQLQEKSATKAEMLRHHSFALGIRTGPDSAIPSEQLSRIRVTTNEQRYKLGAVTGRVVAAWVDFPHHVMEQVRYTHLVPEADGADLYLRMRATSDDVVSISTITVHVLYQSP